MIDPEQVERIVEAALLAADGPVSITRLGNLFTADELGERSAQTLVRTALDTLSHRTAGRGYELVRVASGFRFQVRQEFSPWVGRLFDERPPRYSRALLETLALIVHRQPVTRGDIEQVRGVAVSSSIMRTLSERGWVQAVGQRETPGRPTLYGTTRRFLDDFNLASLDELPPLDELQSFVATPGTEDAQGEETAGADRAAPNAGDARPLAEVVQLPVADQ